MFYLHKMCCLCLKTSVLLCDLFSTDQDGIIHFDKIATSLTKVANIFEFDGDFLLCEGCCNTIDMIYNFNLDFLKNLSTFISYKTILEENLEKKRGQVNVKLEKLKIHNLFKTKLTNIDEGVQLDSIVTKTEFHSPEKIVVKSEVEDIFEAFSDTINDCLIKLEIEEVNIKKECFGEDSEVFLGFEEATDSIVASFSSTSDDEQLSKPGQSQEETEDLEEEQVYLLPIGEEESQEGVKSNSQNSVCLSKKNRIKYKNKKHSCLVCSKTFISKSRLNRHLPIHSGLKSYSCEICKKLFAHKASRDRHMIIHSDERPYACEFCKKVFKRQDHLKGHMLIHSSKKAYSCKECGKSFVQQSHLITHKLIHTNNRLFKCDLCEQKFKQKSHLSSHKLAHDKPFKCHMCMQSFSRKEYLTAHKRKHILNPLCDTTGRPFACDLCDYRFKRNDHLFHHKLTHEKPFKCDLCEDKFARKKNLAAHISKHILNPLCDTTDRPFACDLCDYRFKRSDILLNHKLTHEKPFKCDLCENKFARKTSLDSHRKKHIVNPLCDTTDKPFACDLCDYRFKRTDHLFRHKLTHEKPFKCDLCEDKFARKTSLDLHRKKHSEEKL